MFVREQRAKRKLLGLRWNLHRTGPYNQIR